MKILVIFLHIVLAPAVFAARDLGILVNKSISEKMVIPEKPPYPLTNILLIGYPSSVNTGYFYLDDIAGSPHCIRRLSFVYVTENH